MATGNPQLREVSHVAVCIIFNGPPWKVSHCPRIHWARCWRQDPPRPTVPGAARGTGGGRPLDHWAAGEGQTAAAGTRIQTIFRIKFLVASTWKSCHHLARNEIANIYSIKQSKEQEIKFGNWVDIILNAERLTKVKLAFWFLAASAGLFIYITSRYKLQG